MNPLVTGLGLYSVRGSRPIRTRNTCIIKDICSPRPIWKVGEVELQWKWTDVLLEAPGYEWRIAKQSLDLLTLCCLSQRKCPHIPHYEDSGALSIGFTRSQTQSGCTLSLYPAHTHHDKPPVSWSTWPIGWYNQILLGGYVRHKGNLTKWGTWSIFISRKHQEDIKLRIKWKW